MLTEIMDKERVTEFRHRCLFHMARKQQKHPGWKVPYFLLKELRLRESEGSPGVLEDGTLRLYESGFSQ